MLQNDSLAFVGRSFHMTVEGVVKEKVKLVLLTSLTLVYDEEEDVPMRDFFSTCCRDFQIRDLEDGAGLLNILLQHLFSSEGRKKMTIVVFKNLYLSSLQIVSRIYMEF